MDFEKLVEEFEVTMKVYDLLKGLDESGFRAVICILNDLWCKENGTNPVKNMLVMCVSYKEAYDLYDLFGTLED